MKTKVSRVLLFLFLTFLIGTSPCWAKSKGYFYMVGYSLSKKEVYFSSVIIQKVRSEDFTKEEYVADVALVRDMEAQFQKFMAETIGVDPSDFTVTAKGAYKKKTLAEKYYKKERARYANKGFAASVLANFEYDD